MSRVSKDNAGVKIAAVALLLAWTTTQLADSFVSTPSATSGLRVARTSAQQGRVKLNSRSSADGFYRPSSKDQYEGGPITVAADGACKFNPGPGGWAFVVKLDGSTEEYSGHAAQTTNNRMELQAAIEALQYLKFEMQTERPIRLLLDSQYVVKGITEWIHGWKKRSWRTSTKQAVKNVDLWRQLDELVDSQVQVEWVKGHANNWLHNEADELAQQAASRGRRY